MNKTITKGTCGACFDSIALDKNGKLKRHGWKECGGTRRVGQYGHVYHSGPCFGTGWVPYEVSDACSIAFLGRYVAPAGRRAYDYCEYLKTRPAFIQEGRWHAANETWARGLLVTREDRAAWDGYCTFSTTVVDGDAETEIQVTDREWDTATIPSYNAVHQARTSYADMQYNAILADAQRLYKAIGDWKAAEVKAVEKKGKLVHGISVRNNRVSACGRWLHSQAGYLSSTTDATRITCPKCAAAVVKAA